jgi:hypothetical protein
MLSTKLVVARMSIVGSKLGWVEFKFNFFESFDEFANDDDDDDKDEDDDVDTIDIDLVTVAEDSTLIMMVSKLLASLLLRNGTTTQSIL